jgi:hypothetical protein
MTTQSIAFVDAERPLRFTHAARLKLWFAKGTENFEVTPPLVLANNTLFDGPNAFEPVKTTKSNDATNGQEDNISR